MTNEDITENDNTDISEDSNLESPDNAADLSTSDSILDSVKKVVGLNPEDTSFDMDCILHINAVLSKLHKKGVGPENGFKIHDRTTTWADYMGDNTALNDVPLYVGMCVKLAFDPPLSAAAVQSMERIIAEYDFFITHCSS